MAMIACLPRRQKKGSDKVWWLRIHDMSQWAGGYKTGVEGRAVVDDSRIQDIIDDIRNEKMVTINSQNLV